MIWKIKQARVPKHELEQDRKEENTYPHDTTFFFSFQELRAQMFQLEVILLEVALVLITLNSYAPLVMELTVRGRACCV